MKTKQKPQNKLSDGTRRKCEAPLKKLSDADIQVLLKVFNFKKQRNGEWANIGLGVVYDPAYRGCNPKDSKKYHTAKHLALNLLTNFACKIRNNEVVDIRATVARLIQCHTL